MAVAAVAVHPQNGSLAIATGPGIFATERTIGAGQPTPAALRAI